MPPPLPRCSGWVYSSLISPRRVSLPRKGHRVGLHIVLFEACSAFTRVAAYTLARSPIRDPLSEGFRHFVSSMPAPVASGWSESPGGPCTHWKAPPWHGAHPIPHARDAQRPEFAVGLRYIHSSDWLWPISLLPEGKRQFRQPPLDPIRLNVRKILAVDPRSALVRTALSIGMRQNVVAADLVVQSVEAIAGFRLRFRV